jgi:hypothetical protein
MNVATALRTGVPVTVNKDPFMPSRGPFVLVLLTAVLMVLTLKASRQRRPAAALLGLTLALAMFAAACSSHGVAAGTPAGSYPITVTGTSGTVTHATTVMLQIQ